MPNAECQMPNEDLALSSEIRRRFGERWSFLLGADREKKIRFYACGTPGGDWDHCVADLDSSSVAESRAGVCQARLLRGVHEADRGRDGESVCGGQSRLSSADESGSGQPFLRLQRELSVEPDASTGKPAGTPAQQCAFARAPQFPYWINAGSGAELTNPTTGASIGRLVLKGYLKGPFEKMTSCPSGIGMDSTYDVHYGYNMHMAFRTPGGGTTQYLQPWWKLASHYGRVPGRPLSAVNTNSGTAGTWSFGERQFALGGKIRCTPAGPARRRSARQPI